MLYDINTEDRSEAALRARAQIIIPDEIYGTDLITCEIGGQERDLILNREDAKYLHLKLSHILGHPCADTTCSCGGPSRAASAYQKGLITLDELGATLKELED